MGRSGPLLAQVGVQPVFGLPGGGHPSRPASALGDLFIVLFLCAQILDGVLTYVGLRRFGLGIEANPLMAWLIDLIGPAGALASAKGVAILAGGFLHLFQVHLAVASLTGLYLLVAIVPWTHLLFFF